MAELTWLGDACFRLRGRDVAIVFDPVGQPRGHDGGRARADIITLSGGADDRVSAETLTGEFVLIDGPGEYEIRDIFITGVATGRDEAGRRNTCYTVQLEEMTFCHLGDLGQVLTSDQAEQIGDVDVLMVPVGERRLSVAKVIEVISQLEPGLIVPMMYASGSVATPPGLEPLDKFLREMGLHDLPTRDRLTLRKSDIPEETQVVILTDRSA
jgi:L-ascorbate metabolism protein UlaG (beta-lactamase superfamily)